MYIVYLSQTLSDKSENRIAIGKTEDPLHFRFTYDIYREVEKVWPNCSGPIKVIYEKVSYESEQS